MLAHSQSKGFTLVEMMITLSLLLLVSAVVLTCYIGLQRGFAFSLNWSESRVAQQRVLDSFSVDLRNATGVVVGSGATLLTLTLPSRYAAYETTGYAAGDPQFSGTNQLALPLVSSTTGGIVAVGGNLTVVYSLANNTVSRTVTQSSSGLNASRTVGLFGGSVSVQFKDITGAALSGTLGSSTDTIVPIVITSVASDSPTLPSLSGTMSDTVFLRGKSFQ
ncbi:MAG: prepilin-type N-terminal cleavage/methylation domain-containing protein [Verrucomicrobiota bacterium]